MKMKHFGSKCLAGLAGLELSEEQQQDFLSGTAQRVFNL